MKNTTIWENYLVKIPAHAKGSRYVYRGYDLYSKREVAIKVYRNIQRGQWESDIMKSYGSHPNLPLFYEYFTKNNKGHVVMEFIKGYRLNSPHLPPCKDYSNAVEITLQILEGILHLHEHGILHFDIAPQNILIESNTTKNIKIIDFCGSIKQNSDGIWISKRRAGTKGFMPPEQKTSPIRLYPCSDLYSAARLCYWLIYKSFPIPGASSVVKDKDLNRILLKGMEKDIRYRFQTASEFIEALKYWQSIR